MFCFCFFNIFTISANIPNISPTKHINIVLICFARYCRSSSNPVSMTFLHCTEVIGRMSGWLIRTKDSTTVLVLSYASSRCWLFRCLDQRPQFFPTEKVHKANVASVAVYWSGLLHGYIGIVYDFWINVMKNLGLSGIQFDGLAINRHSCLVILPIQSFSVDHNIKWHMIEDFIHFCLP